MFLKVIRPLFVIACFALSLTSCSPYQEVLKSDDIGEKYTFADSLYQQGKYKKALRLWEQIVPSYRGRPQAERVMYMYADTYYQLSDYLLSSYQFDRFEKSYPQSTKAEEASFKAGMSFYYNSPRYTLDQEETEKGIARLQEFINRYQESEYLDEANAAVAELQTKLEKKAYEIAKQYHKVEIISPPVAIKALDNFISEYPGSPYREGAFYYKLEAAYEYAINSFAYLVEERLIEAKEIYTTMMRYYPNGEYREQADKILAEINSRLEDYI
ncbi:outer membrane protein assembly factor BamD [Croceiramulus getboli]|nr:outer membrane protein assembly factor BamD [Flavobacteriaceae bacterium YJPT1-3]